MPGKTFYIFVGISDQKSDHYLVAPVWKAQIEEYPQQEVEEDSGPLSCALDSLDHLGCCEALPAASLWGKMPHLGVGVVRKLRKVSH